MAQIHRRKGAQPIADAEAERAQGPRFLGIFGTNGDDTIFGTSSDDAIYGLEGNDRLVGLEGNDTLDGGPGDDTIEGREGDDLLYVTGPGSDVARGDTGTDSLFLDFSSAFLGLSGTADTTPTGGYNLILSDSLNSSSPYNHGLNATSIEHFDLIFGIGSENVTLLGSDDIVRGGGGDDRFNLGAGADLLTISGLGSAIVDGGADADMLTIDWADTSSNIVMDLPTSSMGLVSGHLGNADDTQEVSYSAFERLIISTGSGDDIIRTGNGSFATDDVVDLGAGNDLFIDGLAGDTVNGGDGVDGISLSLTNYATDATWNLQNGAATGFDGSYLSFEYFASLSLGGGHNQITTTDFDRNDAVLLGGGDDMLTVLNGHDSVNGEAGSDLLVIDYRAALTSVTTAGGAAGIAAGSGGGVQGQIGDGMTRNVSFDNVERFDIRTGNAGDNVALGTGTRVTDDSVTLGGGDDFAELGRGVDQADGGFGTDGLAADLSTVSDAISINLAANTYSGVAGSSYVNFEYFSGTGFKTGSGNDVVVTADLDLDDSVGLGGGSDSATVFDGSDTIAGGAGTDTLIVDYREASGAITQTAGPDDSGTPGSYSGDFTDGAGRTVTYQEIENFEVHGGSGADTILTGGGIDLLAGGLGADALDGGLGDDVFYYAGVADSASGGVDTISGFDFESDVIDLDVTVTGYAGTATGDLDTASFDADIAAAMSGLAGGLGAHQASLFNVTGGDESGATYLIVDANGTAGYQAGEDYVIRMASLAQPIGTSVDYFISSARPQVVVAASDAIAASETAVLNGDVFADNGSGADQGPALEVVAVNGEAGNVGNQFTLESGALLTLNADGTFSYDPNGAFDATPAAGSGASNPPVQDGFTYTLDNGGTATVTLTIAGVDTNDYLLGTAAADFLVGGIGNDVVLGLAGADTLVGGDGDDIMNGGTGADGMYGGAGDDIYYFDNFSDFAVEAAGGGHDVAYTTISYAMNPGWELDVLAAADVNGLTDIILYGNELDNELRGNAGANFLAGGVGSDALLGYDGIDQLSGGAGNDFLDGGAGGDALIGGAGDDVMIGGSGSDYFDGGTGADGMYGGMGDDVYFFNNFSDFAIEAVGEGNDVVHASVSFGMAAGSAIELVVADPTGIAAIDFAGNELDNTFWGNNGANTLVGAGGDDVLEGFGGNDVLLGGAGKDYLTGGSGDDAIDGGSEGDTLIGGDGNDYLTGGFGTDSLIGGAGNDVLNGGDGPDFMSGESGDDIYYADTTADAVVESAGNGYDTLYVTGSYNLSTNAHIEVLSALDNSAINGVTLRGNQLDNQVYGTNGQDTLGGGSGNDVLIGFGGNDLLEGGTGNDYLDGGAGADQYQFRSTLGAGNVDTLASFVSGTDKIGLDFRFFADVGTAPLNPNAFVLGTAAADADDRVIYDSATGKIFFDADGNGAGAQIWFATVSAGTTIIASDVLGIF